MEKTPEKIVTRETLDEFQELIPSGYELAYKGKNAMTPKAKGYIRGYWGNVVNANEVEQEIEEDQKKGLRVSYEWLIKYQNQQNRGIGYLVQNKFIKKSKDA